VVYDAYRVSGMPFGRYAIDRFPINITLDGLPSTLSRSTYYGIYGIAQLDLSFEIQSDGYYSPQYPTTPQLSIPSITSITLDNISANVSEGKISNVTIFFLLLGFFVFFCLMLSYSYYTHHKPSTEFDYHYKCNIAPFKTTLGLLIVIGFGMNARCKECIIT